MASIKEKSEQFEGHGENSKAPSIKKGTFMQVGTFIDLQTKTYSPNNKNGSASGDEV